MIIIIKIIKVYIKEFIRLSYQLIIFVKVTIFVRLKKRFTINVGVI